MCTRLLGLECDPVCMVVLCSVMLCMLLCYGPEGDVLWAGRQYVMGRKAICFGPEGRGLEGRLCSWYFGGISLSFRAYSCGFMFSGSQESVARQRHDRTVPRVDVL